jgi:hypothetical protein
MMGESALEFRGGKGVGCTTRGVEEVVEARERAGGGDLIDPAGHVKARLQELSCLFGGGGVELFKQHGLSGPQLLNAGIHGDGYTERRFLWFRIVELLFQHV